MAIHLKCGAKSNGADICPRKSTVLVTRPLSRLKLEEGGGGRQIFMLRSRHLLHYFRLHAGSLGMLFGMRGGLLTGKSARGALSGRVRRDFSKSFSRLGNMWETPHHWSGMVMPFSRAPNAVCREACPPRRLYDQVFCLSMERCGPMGSYSGRIELRILGLDKPIEPALPQIMQTVCKVRIGADAQAAEPIFALFGFCAFKTTRCGCNRLAWLADCLIDLGYILMKICEIDWHGYVGLVSGFVFLISVTT